VVECTGDLAIVVFYFVPNFVVFACAEYAVAEDDTFLLTRKLAQRGTSRKACRGISLLDCSRVGKKPSCLGNGPEKGYQRDVLVHGGCGDSYLGGKMTFGERGFPVSTLLC